MNTRESRSACAARQFLAVELILLLVVAGLTAHQLLVAPIVGIADNGDYTRVMNPLGLAHVGTSYEDTVFLWIQPRYQVVTSDTSLLLPSAELLLAGIARGLDAVFSRDGFFDLRLLGAVHLVFYLSAVWLLLRAARSLQLPARVVVWTGVLLATTDVAYVAYLNSFYSEPASLIFAIALVGIGLGLVRAQAPNRAATCAYLICAALFVTTKPQNYALALPLAGLPLVLLVSRRWQRLARLVVPLAFGLVLLWGFLFVSLPDLLRFPARWNGVFYGLLIDSPSPSEDLQALGLEPDLARWIGTPGIKMDGDWIAPPIMEAAARYGFLDVAVFYLRHPGRLVHIASLCAKQTFVWRYRGIGNYTRESGKPPASHAPSYLGWSDMQQRLFPRNLWFLAAFFIAFAIVSLWELRQGLDTPAGGTAFLSLTLAAMTTMAFAVVVLAGGIEDTVVDLFMFRVLFDACLLIALAWVATRFARLLPVGATRSSPVASTE